MSEHSYPARFTTTNCVSSLVIAMYSQDLKGRISMLIYRRLRSKPSISLLPRQGITPSSGAVRAFTLIELLVVIAIIALLMSILMPSLRNARDHAKEVVCGAHLRSFGIGLANYTYENNEWLPGLNTSGVALRALRGSDAEALRNSALPVQSFDWMTPIFDEYNLPEKRSERFKYLLKRYTCPALAGTSSIAMAFGNTPDEEDFEQVKEWSAVSYLMPAYFQYWGDDQAGRTLAPMESFPQMKVRAKAAPEGWKNVRVKNYVSRLDRIGTPAGKIFAADGTRYLDDSLLLYHDIAPFPTYFGSFTTSGAWWRGSTAYGVHEESMNWSRSGGSLGSPSNGRNLFLSYRHSVHQSGNGYAENNHGMLNAVFFDGHVELMNDRDSRKIGYWYPKGAVVKQAGQGMTDVEEGTVIH